MGSDEDAITRVMNTKLRIHFVSDQGVRMTIPGSQIVIEDCSGDYPREVHRGPITELMIETGTVTVKEIKPS